MGMWWIYIVYVIFVYLMIKNIVVYKNQRKIIYAIHKYNRRIFNDIYTYGYANRRISYDEIRSWWVCLFDPLCWTCRKMISNKIYNELVPYLYFCGPGGDEIVNVSQKQVALNVKMSEYDSVICPKCGAIAFTKEDTPSWLTEGCCFRCGQKLNWRSNDK